MIRVGTCSWTEKTLLKSGEFYPTESKSAEDRLRYYATSFDTVEIDSSYYAIPDMRNASLWAERTPADFVFHVKAFSALTGHAVEPRTLPAEIFRSLPAGQRGERHVYVKAPELLQTIGQRFADSLAPLKDAGVPYVQVDDGRLALAQGQAEVKERRAKEPEFVALAGLTDYLKQRINEQL